MQSKLLDEIAADFEMDPQEFVAAVKSQCFKDGAASDAQLLMLLSFAKQYGLNPMARECYAFVQGGKMQVGVQADGWTKIAIREPNFNGQEIEWEHGDNGELIAVVSRTYVKGREHPTVYRAVLKEWARGTDVWKSMPSHQLFLKARNEGLRFTFGIPAYDPDDIDRIQASGTAAADTGIVTPVSEQPRALDYEPRVTLEEAFGTLREREKVTARVTSEGKPFENAAPQAASPIVAGNSPEPQPARPPAGDPEPEACDTAQDLGQCQFAGHDARGNVTARCPAAAAGVVDFKGQKFSLCAHHAANYKPKRRARPKGSKNDEKNGGENTQESIGESVGVPRSETAVQANGSESATGAAALGAVEAQRAAGLEKIDPTESPLETFIRAHDVPQKRVDIFLAKKLKDSLADLDEGERSELLGMLKKSYGEEI